MCGFISSEFKKIIPNNTTPTFQEVCWVTQPRIYCRWHKNISKKKKQFCGFSMGRNQYWAGRVYDLCVYYMTGTPEGSVESGFMEKPGFEPATPGLQGKALIHYTTGA